MEIRYDEEVLPNASYSSVLTSLGIVCLWIGGISGDLFTAARARHHRGPSHRVTRQLVSDGEHSHELEIYSPESGLTVDDASHRKTRSGAASAAVLSPTIHDRWAPLSTPVVSPDLVRVFAQSISSLTTRGPPRLS